jgi:hypothetical protein
MRAKPFSRRNPLPRKGFFYACTRGTAIVPYQKKEMKKILLGALVCAAVAGVVFYLYDPEKFNETLDDLKDTADDALSKVKSGISKHEKDLRSAVS